MCGLYLKTVYLTVRDHRFGAAKKVPFGGSVFVSKHEISNTYRGFQTPWVWRFPTADPTIRICSMDFPNSEKGLVDSKIKNHPILLKKYIPTVESTVLTNYHRNHQNNPLCPFFLWDFCWLIMRPFLVLEPSRKWDGLPLASFWWKCISGHGGFGWAHPCGVFYRSFFLRVEKHGQDICFFL